MKEKALYVVKKNHVEAASGVIDMLVKKLNLAPIIDFLNFIFQLLLERVNNYQSFTQLKNMIDLVVGKIDLFRKFSII